LASPPPSPLGGGVSGGVLADEPTSAQTAETPNQTSGGSSDSGMAGVIAAVVSAVVVFALCVAVACAYMHVSSRQKRDAKYPAAGTPTRAKSGDEPADVEDVQPTVAADNATSGV